MGDPEDDDQAPRLVDDEDDPQVADALPPEVRVGEVSRARRAGLPGQREDRAAKPGRSARVESTKLPPGCRRQLDPVGRPFYRSVPWDDGRSALDP
jgi:hypothetical protein